MKVIYQWKVNDIWLSLQPINKNSLKFPFSEIFFNSAYCEPNSILYSAGLKENPFPSLQLTGGKMCSRSAKFRPFPPLFILQFLFQFLQCMRDNKKKDRILYWVYCILRIWKSALNPRSSSILEAQNQTFFAFDKCSWQRICVEVFIFLILGILKIILFLAENLQNPSFYIKENSSGRKSEIKICLFYFISF